MSPASWWMSTALCHWRNTLKSIFEAEGYDVFEATDGAEMHQILSEYDINLVIMDINL
ncbi:hypothetical protein MJM83_29595, partial [Salmonella enterica subsp. enterica serovar Montevideo]|nr:hypothetical protein [Salmonella enterica subsp. enterica serovar Montevideo]